MLGDISYHKATLQSEGKHSIHIVNIRSRAALGKIKLFYLRNKKRGTVLLLSYRNTSGSLREREEVFSQKCLEKIFFYFVTLC